jgi:hypothetical protein
MIMGENYDLDEVVLYHGSLEELNSRDSDKQYRFTKNNSYISSNYVDETLIRDISNEILKLGFSGIVNARTISKTDIRENLISYTTYRMEGTPIVRVDNNS